MLNVVHFKKRMVLSHLTFPLILYSKYMVIPYLLYPAHRFFYTLHRIITRVAFIVTVSSSLCLFTIVLGSFAIT